MEGIAHLINDILEETDIEGVKFEAFETGQIPHRTAFTKITTKDKVYVLEIKEFNPQP